MNNMIEVMSPENEEIIVYALFGKSGLETALKVFLNTAVRQDVN